MPKDERFYFSHDYNARNDKKISALVREFKSAGYGIYWCMAEMLHEEGGSLEFDELTISAISKDLNENFEFVKNVVNKCISNYKLFQIDKDNILIANRVNRNLDKRKAISKIRSDAGKNGVIIKQMQANAKQMQANVQQNLAKESKGKESKGNILRKNFETMPTKEMFNGLPDVKNGSVVQLIKISSGVDATKEDVNGLWEIFKVQNLTGNRYYANEDAVYSHFINWSKTQKKVNILQSSEKRMVI